MFVTAVFMYTDVHIDLKTAFPHNKSRFTNLTEMHGNQKTKQKKKSIVIYIAYKFE